MGPEKARKNARSDPEWLSRCVICGSATLSPRFHIAFPDFGPAGTHVWPLDATPPVPHWTIVGCGDCGVHFPNPFPARTTIDAYYSRQGSPSEWEQVHYVDESDEKTEGWNRFAEKLTRLNGGAGTLLEVGPAAGHLLKAARNQGWSIVGVEAAPKFTTALRERGLPYHEGTLDTFASDDRYDLIVMLDVLEHLHDPVRDLRRCAQLLKPTGAVVISTCDIRSLAARHYGLKWRQLVVSHTFYWTRESLAIALRRAGLEPTTFSSTRWWDPDPELERRARTREFAKLVVRQVVHHTWLPLARRFSAVSAFQRGHPRFDHWLDFKIGDQPVMSEVVLVIARPTPGTAPGG